MSWHLNTPLYSSPFQSVYFSFQIISLIHSNLCCSLYATEHRQSVYLLCRTLIQRGWWIKAGVSVYHFSLCSHEIHLFLQQQPAITADVFLNVFLVESLSKLLPKHRSEEVKALDSKGGKPYTLYTPISGSYLHDMNSANTNRLVLNSKFY